jgi:peroxiredoxin
MNHIIKCFIVTVLSLAVLSCSNKNNLHIQGKVEGDNSGYIYLQKFDNKMYRLIDSAKINDDGTFKFERQDRIPEIYGLTTDTTKNSFMIFIDRNIADVTFDAADYGNTKVEGSALQDLFVKYRNTDNVAIEDYIRENPSSLVSAYVLYREYAYRLTPEEIRHNLSLLDKSLYESQYVKFLENYAVTLESVSIGKKAPDFELTSTDGNRIHFYDKLGNGYLLLDFWASWCGPCRMENPNVVEAYNKYKDKGFDVFGVSLDRERKDWLDAIAADSLTWTNASDLLLWESRPAALYGVRAIPSNFLVDTDGIIIAKNIRGKELGNKLNELFSK